MFVQMGQENYYRHGFQKYKAFIDEVPEQVHQDLVIALSHDGVF